MEPPISFIHSLCLNPFPARIILPLVFLCVASFSQVYTKPPWGTTALMFPLVLYPHLNRAPPKVNISTLSSLKFNDCLSKWYRTSGFQCPSSLVRGHALLSQFGHEGFYYQFRHRHSILWPLLCLFGVAQLELYLHHGI
jgi:hypothetical protein